MSSPEQIGLRDAQHDLTISLEYLKKRYSLTDPAKEVRVLKYWIDELNMRHLRFQQVFQGLAVFGQQQIVHIQSDGAVRDITGDYRTGLANLDLTPKLTKDQAVEIVRENFSGQLDQDRSGDIAVELMIYPQSEQTYLAYAVVLPIWQDQRPMNLRCFVDAKEGKSLDQIPELNINASHLQSPIEAELNRQLADQ